MFFTNAQELKQIKEAKQQIKEQQQKNIEQQQKLEQQLKELEERLNQKIQARNEQKAKLAQQQRTQQVQARVATKPTTKSFNNNCEQWRGLLAQYDWNIDEAMLVMQKESGCNPNAVSKTNDHGLFQLHNQPVYDPAQNVAIAYQKYKARGWRPWYAVRGILW